MTIRFPIALVAGLSVLAVAGCETIGGVREAGHSLDAARRPPSTT